MEKELAARKKIRLEGYDYSSAGYYYITICVENRHEILGKIVGDAHGNLICNNLFISDKKRLKMV